MAAIPIPVFLKTLAKHFGKAVDKGGDNEEPYRVRTQSFGDVCLHDRLFRERGGIGRHARLRILCRKAWGFKSPLAHIR